MHPTSKKMFIGSCDTKEKVTKRYLAGITEGVERTSPKYRQRSIRSRRQTKKEIAQKIQTRTEHRSLRCVSFSLSGAFIYTYKTSTVPRARRERWFRWVRLLLVRPFESAAALASLQATTTHRLISKLWSWELQDSRLSSITPPNQSQFS